MIAKLIVQARRRYLRNKLLAQGTYAINAGLAGLVLLLVAGTQILDWRLLIAVSLLTLGVGAYRTLRRLPSAYVIAQIVDRHLLLSDAISTALYFSLPDARGSTPMRDGQRELAERMAAEADLERAIPLEMPRATYALAMLGLLATGLFALRYGVSHRLDFGAPLARIIMQNFSSSPAPMASMAKDQRKPKPEAPKPQGLSFPEGDSEQAQQLDAAPDSVLDTTGIPNEVNQPLGQADSSQGKAESSGSEKAEGEPGDAESSETADASSGENAQEAEQGSQKSSQNAAAKNGSPSRANSEQNGSLVSKLRDAMSNLLSRMRQQSNGSGSQKQASTGQNPRQPGAQRSGQQNSAAGQGQQQGGQESADGESQQPGAEGKDGQNSQAKGSGHSADQQASNQPGSGIGKQDGSKDPHLAEQLAAMGKISEIIGKRSANVTGEITVEVPSSQQQLRTGYTQNSATHSDAGGDISRDEVPVIFQQYVQQYFEQVRKQADRRGETSTRSKVQNPASKTQPPSL